MAASTARSSPTVLGIVAALKLDVLRDIDHDGTWAAGARNVERLVQYARKRIDVLDEIIVLSAWAGDADGIAFLEGIIADEMRRHLSGDADQGNRIHQRVRQARDGVGSARA
jgi:hypothetical protein